MKLAQRAREAKDSPYFDYTHYFQDVPYKIFKKKSIDFINSIYLQWTSHWKTALKESAVSTTIRSYIM